MLINQISLVHKRYNICVCKFILTECWLSATNAYSNFLLQVGQKLNAINSNFGTQAGSGATGANQSNSCQWFEQQMVLAQTTLVSAGAGN
jgi:hypothetical protein